MAVDIVGGHGGETGIIADDLHHIGGLVSRLHDEALRIGPIFPAHV